MTETQHVKAFRLFDLSKAEVSGGHFPLTEWEKQHLRQCAECQAVVEVFGRQLKRGSYSLLLQNGDVNQKDGYYKTVCCGIEEFVPAGSVFSDCPRHKN